MSSSKIGGALLVGFFGVLLTPGAVEAKRTPFKPIDSWENYYRANRSECWPSFVRLRKPVVRKSGKVIYRLEGTRLIEKRPLKRKSLRIGVLSAPKDASLLTIRNIEEFMEEFRREEVDWVIVNGDIGSSPENMQKVLEPVAQPGVPVLLTIGNGESVPHFNDAFASLVKTYPNVYNMNFTRVVDTPEVTFISVPGYYDRRFIYSEEGCHYGRGALKRLEDLIKRRKGRDLVLISHGPPKGKGAHAIDQVYTRASVGDPGLNRVMKKHRVRFGIFGHILEAGSRGVTLKQAAVEENQWAKSLLVNAGSVSAIPWRLIDGTLSYGMAMLVTIEKGRMKYSVLRSSLHKIQNSGEET